ncbi:MAG: chaperone modulator CbpM [Cyanobium sp.]
MSDDILHPASGDEPMDIEELLERSGLHLEEVRELVELGVLKVCASTPRLTFVSRTVIQARRAARLRDDFGLNTPGMALALTHLARIDVLENRLRCLEAAQPR